MQVGGPESEEHLSIDPIATGRLHGVWEPLHNLYIARPEASVSLDDGHRRPIVILPIHVSITLSGSVISIRELLAGARVQGGPMLPRPVINLVVDLGAEEKHERAHPEPKQHDHHRA